MKQVIQNYKSGELKLTDVPVPRCGENSVLVKNHRSLISIGTEKSVIGLGQKSLLGKAMARPEQVKRLIEKVKNEGLLSSFEQAMNRLDAPIPLGYSSAGMVIETGKNVKHLKPEDRVACIGQGFASHAEIVAVPEILCCKLPDGVSFEEGSFGMLAIIAMHGVRLANLSFGENVGVIGLGLLGLLAAQILTAYGCNVIASDLDQSKIEIARNLGIEHTCQGGAELVERAKAMSDGHGLDAVILTLATTSSQPVSQAVELSRFRGRVVLVGVADIHPNRNEMWEKEVEIIVSKAGGPGSLEAKYEKDGNDYPLGHVRWTQGRNLKEFIRLLERGVIKTNTLITHSYLFEDAERAYSDIMAGKDGPHVGVLLKYSDEIPDRKPVIIRNSSAQTIAGKVNVGVVGAGLFGKSILIPEFVKTIGVKLSAVATSNGINAENVAKRFGIPVCTTNSNDIISNKDIDAVAVLTPHSAHASMVCSALGAGKHVFVEKPLCINSEQLNEIIEAYKNSDKILMVGYNRRFSTHAKDLKSHFEGRLGPLTINYRVNAGYVPSHHWVHSSKEGGSRVIGEMCHFVDFIQFLTGALVEKVYAEMVSCTNSLVVLKDNVVITVKMNDGSVASIIYSAEGDRACPRERVEVYGGRLTAILEDYRSLSIYKKGKKKTYKKMSQDMGYSHELSNFVKSVKGEEKIGMTPSEIFNSTLAVFAIDESLSSGMPKTIQC